jgi:hypothetical protein
VRRVYDSSLHFCMPDMGIQMQRNKESM